MPVDAFHNEQTVHHYELERHTRSNQTPSPGEIFNITFDNTPEHNHEILETDYKVTIEDTIGYTASSDGTWNITARVNGVDEPGCYWYIETVAPGGFLTGDLTLTTHYTMHCDLGMLGAIPPGNNTSTLRNSVKVLFPGGLDFSTISVIISREDIVLMTQDTNFEALTGLTAGEFAILPLLAIVGLYLWTRQDMGLRLFGTTLILLDAGLVVAFYARADAWPGILVLFPLFVAAWIYTTLRFAFEIKNDAVARRREMAR